MARRIKSPKRSKYMGNRTFGGGNAKNRRGKGNRGGVGRAGWHKHNWLRTIKAGENNKRKYGFKSSRFKPETLPLETIVSNAFKCEKDASGALIVNALHHKIVGNVAVPAKMIVTAYAFSASAKKAIEAAGGSCKQLKKPKAPKALKAPAGAKAPEAIKKKA